MMPQSVLIPLDAMAHLSAVDPVMKGIIELVGRHEYTVDPDLWRSLVGSIVGQQLSIAAARTIRGRIAALGGEGFPSPQTILSTPHDALRACGLSRAKTHYVLDLATRWDAGEIEPSEFVHMDDVEVIERLTRVRGVGRWTAEMVLVFCLDRPDVLALDDLGIRSAVQKSYRLPDRPAKQELARIGEIWRPFRTYASLYLWRSLQ